MELNSNEQKAYDTIAKIMNAELTRKEAMFELLAAKNVEKK